MSATKDLFMAQQAQARRSGCIEECDAFLCASCAARLERAQADLEATRKELADERAGTMTLQAQLRELQESNDDWKRRYEAARNLLLGVFV